MRQAVRVMKIMATISGEKIRRKHQVECLAILVLVLVSLAGELAAHPLGQLSINHYARLTMVAGGVDVRYVVDLAELPTFREAQVADTDASGEVSPGEMDAYLAAISGQYLSGLVMTIDGATVPLTLVGREGAILPGQTGSAAMGLATMRLVFNLTAPVDWAGTVHQFRFENGNEADKPGWRELVVTARDGLTVYDSSIAGNGLTDELLAYPESRIGSPLDERRGEWSVVRGDLPAGTRPLVSREGTPVAPAKDRFLALITVPKLTPTVILIGLLIAFGLGAIHALSPGHGKALVGAYLAGSQGTLRHATLLGLVVTVSHTLTVYLGGLAFLLASKYVMPERLYPILSFISGAMITIIGAGLLLRRIRWSPAILGHTMHHLIHDHEHDHHHHTAAGVDDEKLSLRSLVRLGISGGIIPCPSAWILMLGAISLNRTAYGLVLILAFSLGLACVLTLIGILFVVGSRMIERIPGAGGLLGILPVVSAVIVTAIGAAISWRALQEAGIDLAALWTAEIESGPSASAAAILGMGLVIGLRHALDADHLAAVSAIVCERKNILSSLLIGGLWGIGHTISLLIAGIGVLVLNLKIERYEKALEFCVALMLIGLGLNVLVRLFRERALHAHPHQHGANVHYHPHLHQPEEPATTATRGWNLRPLFIGLVHGLAGSAALMLGVLATISSAPLAFAYILIFGIGSIGGMMIMSVILGLPAHFTVTSFARANLAVRAISGAFSLGFGVWLAWEIGIVEGLLR